MGFFHERHGKEHIEFGFQCPITCNSIIIQAWRYNGSRVYPAPRIVGLNASLIFKHIVLSQSTSFQADKTIKGE